MIKGNWESLGIKTFRKADQLSRLRDKAARRVAKALGVRIEDITDALHEEGMRYDDGDDLYEKARKLWAARATTPSVIFGMKRCDDKSLPFMIGKKPATGEHGVVFEHEGEVYIEVIVPPGTVLEDLIIGRAIVAHNGGTFTISMPFQDAVALTMRATETTTRRRKHA